MTLYHGWTPTPKKICIRCGGDCDSLFYQLCEKCRTHDAAMQLVEDARAGLTDLLNSLTTHNQTAVRRYNDWQTIGMLGRVEFQVSAQALKENNRQITRRYIASLRKQGPAGNRRADILQAQLDSAGQ